SVRQTLALETKLERDRRLAAREAVRDAAHEAMVRAHHKRDRIRKVLTPEVWNEYEGEDEEEVEGLLEVLDDLVMDQSEEDGFPDAPIEDCARRIRTRLGLPAPASGPDETADDHAPEQAPRRSSA